MTNDVNNNVNFNYKTTNGDKIFLDEINPDETSNSKCLITDYQQQLVNRSSTRCQYCATQNITNIKL